MKKFLICLLSFILLLFLIGITAVLLSFSQIQRLMVLHQEYLPVWILDLGVFYPHEAPETTAPLGATTSSSRRRSQSLENCRPELIAHAGGEVDLIPYLNCREALETSFLKGYKMIELDLMVTSDGFVVAGHDWETFHEQTGHPERKKSPLKLDEFRKEKILGKYTPLDADEIVAFFTEHPDLMLVTDKLCDPDMLLKHFGPIKERMIVESDEAHYKACSEAGFADVMLTVEDLFAGNFLQYQQRLRRKGIRNVHIMVIPSSFLESPVYRLLKERFHLRFAVFDRVSNISPENEAAFLEKCRIRSCEPDFFYSNYQDCRKMDFVSP